MDVILQATSVGHRYAVSRTDSLTGVDLKVCKGDAVGIVGESGSGKSTLAKLLSGVMAPTTGEVLVGGRRWVDVRQRDPERRRVQMIFQDPFNALNPRMSAIDTVAEAVRHWERVPSAEALRQAGQLLDDMGLSRGSMQRRPGGLSGGQCQRVGIARALACKPDLLIADEPTSALDVSVQAQILNILVDLRAQQDLALVLISHDLAVVRYLTDTAIVMAQGVVVETGTTHDLLTRPTHSYTQELLDSVVHTSSSRTTDRPT